MQVYIILFPFFSVQVLRKKEPAKIKTNRVYKIYFYLKVKVAAASIN
ncbi:hypothetical protein J2S21_001468 [Peribacillus cavernae]|nr:hypothetical protein [Peribacillus cavernae]